MTQGEDILELIQNDSGYVWAEARQGWNVTTDVCNWDGVTCDLLNSVSTLNLEGSNLLATIPTSLGRIVSLTHLYLGSNRLYGTVPDEVASLPNLVQIDLSINKLRGPLPTMSSTRIEVMNFAHNQFSGKLPQNIGKGMSRLSILDVKYNRLGDTIPDAIGNLASLKDLDLSNNKFAGLIPESLGQLVNLEGLFLSNNMLIGGVPPSLTRENMALTELFLHGNKLSGTLPVALADLPNIRTLFIDDNKFTGTVPQELCDLNLNEAFFSNYAGSDIDQDYVDLYGGEDDDIYGEDDDEYKFETRRRAARDDFFGGYNEQANQALNRHGRLRNQGRQSRKRSGSILPVASTSGAAHSRRAADAGSADRDGCTSIACPVGYQSARPGGKDGVFPCVECEQDFLNPYLGSNKCFEVTQDHILRVFYQVTDGPNWSGGDTWKDDSIPACDKDGVSCNSSGDIVSIVLPGRNVAGTIPEQIGFLRHLEVLNLSDNILEGNLPSELHWAPLQSLDISGNMITGFVPPELCQKIGVNGNGKDSALKCDIIACAAGSYSSTGRAEAGEGHSCSPCPAGRVSKLLGSKRCVAGHADPLTTSADDSTGVGAGGVAILTILLLSILAGGVILWKRIHDSGDLRDLSHNDLRDDPKHGGGDFRVTENDGGSVTEYCESVAENCGASISTADTPDNAAPPPVQRIGLESNELAPMNSSSRSEWEGIRDLTHDVWLDVPKIT